MKNNFENCVIDLHVHTTYSDGSYTPKEVVRLAKDIGLSAIAITDHDTVGGVEQALIEGDKLGIIVIPGVEVSVDFGDSNKEMHILGYFSRDKYKAIDNILLENMRNRRSIRNVKMISVLHKLGYDITLKDVEKFSEGEVIGRPHFARALIEKEYFRSFSEVFDKCIGDGRLGFVKREKMFSQDALKAIDSTDGLSFLAHPKLLGVKMKKLKKILREELIPNGLKGIEVYHSENTLDYENNILDVANEFNIMISGGSDFHGNYKKEISLGVGRGNMKISSDLLNNFIGKII